jgi:hypothetical protein
MTPSNREIAIRDLKVCIYGGRELGKTPAKFIDTLAYQILERMPAVIVTGGFLRWTGQPAESVTTDTAAWNGARRWASEHKVNLNECFEAWIPEPELDIRDDVPGLVRMSEKDGVAIQVMKGRTPLGRRLALAAGVDIVVTISGERHTEVVVEQALELGRPVLPIPDAGGDSEKLLREHRKRLAENFDPGTLDKCLDLVSKTISEDPEKAAASVVNLIRTAKVGRCLVLLPFDKVHDKLYEDVIRPAIAKHMLPLRLDELPASGAIYSSFAEAMQTSSAVIADITALNQNVMYEVGFAHGRGLTPMIYTRDTAVLKQLPVYFRTLNIRQESIATPLNTLIEDYLTSLRSSRRVNQITA